MLLHFPRLYLLSFLEIMFIKERSILKLTDNIKKKIKLKNEVGVALKHLLQKIAF